LASDPVLSVRIAGLKIVGMDGTRAIHLDIYQDFPKSLFCEDGEREAALSPVRFLALPQPSRRDPGDQPEKVAIP
jgi:hypothetical protein